MDEASFAAADQGNVGEHAPLLVLILPSPDMQLTVYVILLSAINSPMFGELKNIYRSLRHGVPGRRNMRLVDHANAQCAECVMLTGICVKTIIGVLDIPIYIVHFTLKYTNI